MLIRLRNRIEVQRLYKLLSYFKIKTNLYEYDNNSYFGFDLVFDTKTLKCSILFSQDRADLVDFYEFMHRFTYKSKLSLCYYIAPISHLSLEGTTQIEYMSNFKFSLDVKNKIVNVRLCL